MDAAVGAERKAVAGAGGGEGGLQRSALEPQSARSSRRGGCAEVAVAGDGQSAAAHGGAAAVGVGAGKCQRATPCLGESAGSREDAGVAQGDGGVGVETATSAAKGDAAVGAERKAVAGAAGGEGGLQGAAVEHQRACGGRRGGCAEVAVAGDGQSAAAHGGAAAVGVGAGKCQRATPCLGESAGSREDAGVAQGDGGVGVETATSAAKGDAAVGAERKAVAGAAGGEGGLQGAAVEHQRACGGRRGGCAEVAVAGDGQRAARDGGAAGVGVGGSQCGGTCPCLGQATRTADDARERLGAAAAHGKAGAAADGDGTAVVGAGAQRAGHVERAGVHRCVTGVGVGTRQAQRAASGFGKDAATGDTAGVGEQDRSVGVKGAAVAIKGDASAGCEGRVRSHLERPTIEREGAIGVPEVAVGPDLQCSAGDLGAAEVVVAVAGGAAQHQCPAPALAQSARPRDHTRESEGIAVGVDDGLAIQGDVVAERACHSLNTGPCQLSSAVRGAQRGAGG